MRKHFFNRYRRLILSHATVVQVRPAQVGPREFASQGVEAWNDWRRSARGIRTERFSSPTRTAQKTENRFLHRSLVNLFHRGLIYR